MKKLLTAAVIGALAFVPSLAFAAYNDVSLTTDTVLSVGGITVNVSGSTASIESIVVGASSFDVVLQSGSSLAITAPNLNMLDYSSNNAIAATITCTASASSVSFSGTGAVSITVTPSATLCGAAAAASTGGGGGIVGLIGSSGGGGGGGGGSVTAPAAPAPAPAPAAANASGLSNAQVDAIVSLLQSFGADQSVIDNVRASLKGTAGSSSSAVVGGNFSVALSLGKTHADVKRLQVALNSDADTQVSASGVGSPGNETNYFGAKTKISVQKFQVKYGIAKAGDAGYGNVGPATRAKLNALFAK